MLMQPFRGKDDILKCLAEKLNGRNSEAGEKQVSQEECK